MADDRDIPSAEEILAFLKDAKGKITKREIARHFGIRGPDKVLLKRTLRDMTEAGMITGDHAKALRPADALPSVTVVEFSHVDSAGEVLLKVPSVPLTETPIIRLEARSKKHTNMGRGDRALARLTRISSDKQIYRAQVIKRLQSYDNQMLGIFRGGDHGGRLVPVDRRNKDEFVIAEGCTGGAQDGELVLVAALPTRGKRHLAKGAKVLECLGDVMAPKSISLIAIHANDIPTVFPDAALKQAEKASPPSAKGRVDLRDVPLVTIDPVDARDHDDAVYAAPDDDPNNKDGWHTIVAIADVAAFVTPGSPLDDEARTRGNSCYFPDRVVPMLPEALSNGLCSLKPHEDRAAIACHMWFDADGNKLRHKFERAIIRSHGNIAYERVQRALDGDPDEEAAALLDVVLRPLKGCFDSLMRARAAREPLDLDLPERKILMNERGEVTAIVERERLDAHRIVEEMMVNANVAAAEELVKRRVIPLYRIHEEPSDAKLEALRDFLKEEDLTLAKGTVIRPQLFNGILNRVADEARGPQIHEMILRSQTQAYYGPDPVGHFGLALSQYAHFTSPIRRYADLIVHRGLIAGCKLGDDGWRAEGMDELTEIGDHISKTERRAMAAERQTTERYLASFLETRVGDEFQARVNGVTGVGLFVTLQPSGGDGLIHIKQLGNEYFVHDEARQALVGEKTGTTYGLGDTLTVRLENADRFTGTLMLTLIDPETGMEVDSGRRRQPPRRSRGPGSGRSGKKPGTNARAEKSARKGRGKQRRR